jgi:phage terminase small subunit
MASHTKGSHISTMPRLVPPSTLSAASKVIFTHIVGSVDPSHFSPVDLPLLEGYANGAALATEAAQRLDREGAVDADGKMSPWLAVSEKAQKQLVALSARLRICPQSRFDRLSAGANSRTQPEALTSGRREKWDDLIAR